MSSPILEVDDLHLSFASRDGVTRAVEGISYQVHAGEMLGVVGESGCGKSVTAMAILRLLPPAPTTHARGAIRFRGEDLLQASEARMQEIRGNAISMIFQDPMTSLNPVLTIGEQIAEVLILHQRMGRKAAWERAAELLALVNIPDPQRRVKEYPHQFSGGMRQRAMIALALACKPAVLIADEPTTALDVTIQAAILDLMKALQRETGMGMVLITHDMGVVAEMADRVAVMYAGQIVETGPVHRLFARPAHPYTSLLLSTIPRLSGQRKTHLRTISGTVPDVGRWPQGCRFRARCPLADEVCATVPPLAATDDEGLHLSACWHTDRMGALA